jgi:hypothetical protein
VGAGISGLACAKRLQEYDKDFLLISENIGGRIRASEDGTTNYGAFFVCSDYYHVLKYVTIKSRIKLSDFCFHNNDKNYVLFTPASLPYIFQFIRVLKPLYTFRRSLCKIRKAAENVSQKKAIENDSFLHGLYMQNAVDFVREQKIEKGTNRYLSQALYSTTFSQITEMNAFSFLQFLLPLITPIYTFTFEKERMIEPFREKIVHSSVEDIMYEDRTYRIKFDDKIVHAKNVVLATEIDWSKKFAGVKETNKPVSTNMLHVKGIPANIFTRKFYHLFSPPSNVQAIANLKDGNYLFYYKNERPVLKDFFKDPEVIAHHYWNPAGSINGHTLIECNRGNNLYLIGDYNVVGLEESYITGIYAANQIINL